MLFFLSAIECGENILLEAPDMQALPGTRRNCDNGILSWAKLGVKIKMLLLLAGALAFE